MNNVKVDERTRKKAKDFVDGFFEPRDPEGFEVDSSAADQVLRKKHARRHDPLSVAICAELDKRARRRHDPTGGWLGWE